MRLPRMTTRRWMVLVAVVGIVLTGLHFWQLTRDYLLRSEIFAAKESASRLHAEWIRVSRRRLAKEAGALNSTIISAGSEEIEELRAAYYSDLKTKYARAAAHPWLPVQPDPPEPKSTNPNAHR